MKMKDTTRTRMTGYFGIAVATLLTPAGKLISSAIAAATVVGLVSMGTPPKPAKVSKSAPPVVYTGAEYINSELLNPGQLPGTEIGSDTSVTEETNEVIKLPSVASIKIAATNSTNNGPSNGPSGGGLPDSLPLGSGPGPDFPKGPDDGLPEIPKPDPKPTKCLTLYSESLKTESTDSRDKETEACEPEVVLNSPESEKPADPTQPPYMPPEVGDIPKDVPPIITASFPPGTPGDQPAGDQPAGDQLILPLVTAAAIPEPSTLGLLLLGVISLGWVHRRKTDV